jgi:hypothetical protein
MVNQGAIDFEVDLYTIRNTNSVCHIRAFVFPCVSQLVSQRKPHIGRMISIQGVVRFYAGYRIKQHASLRLL